MYNSEGRTRSTRRKQFQGATLLSDDTDLSSTVLTPPVSQPQLSGSSVKTRRLKGTYDSDPIDFDQPPPTPTPSIPPPSPATPSPMKRRLDYEPDNFDHPPSTPKRTRRFLTEGLLSKRNYEDHYVSSTSSGQSDGPLVSTSFHLDDMSLSNIYDEDHQSWVGLNSANDPFLTDKRRELHTPSPPLSPNMDLTTPIMTTHPCSRPETPTPRPETPGGMSSPLTSAMETGIGSGIVDHDDTHVLSVDHDESALTAVTSLSSYGPPPTPMAPPRSYNNRDGNIVHVRLKQFMTHENFSRAIKPGVTFVHGKNGSGKSAIQVGLKILFAEKAANTNRASSIKQFIKRGYDFGEIEAHLTNYNGTVDKKKYGELIQLKRRITMSGSSTYKICSPDGKTWRPIKGNELKLILYKLGIDPNNPFQFLQQDRNREKGKAGSNTASRDFTKFNQATQLAELKEMVECTQENLEVAKRLVREKTILREEYISEEDEQKKRLDHIYLIENNRGRLRELDCELQWAEVAELEAEHEEIKKVKSKLFIDSAKLKIEKKEKEDQISSMKGKKGTDTKLLTEVRVQIQSLEQSREEKNKALKKARITQNRALTQQRSLNNSIAEINNVIKRLEREQTNEVISYEEENQKHQADIEHCQEMIGEKNTILDRLREERDALHAQVLEIQAEEQKAKQKVEQLEKQMKETKKELNKKNNFGRQMPILLEKIDKNKRWNFKPVGPLGKHINVPDAKYAPLIEHILYPALFTFVVFTKNDFEALRTILSEVYTDKDKGKVTVVLLPHEDLPDFMRRLNVVKENLRNFKTVLSCVRVNDPVVERGIVEKTLCERLILFEKNNEAAQVMKDSRNVPSDVFTAYTLDWYKVTPYPRYQFQPVTGRKFNTDILPMAKGDVSDKIQEEIQRKKEKINVCYTHLKGENGLITQLKRKDSEISAIIKQINQLDRQIKHARSCIRLGPAAESAERDVSEEINSEMTRRQEREKEIGVILKELEFAKEEIATLVQEVEKIEAQLPDLKNKMEQLESDQAGHSEYVRKMQNELETASRELVKCEDKIKIVRDKENKVYYALEAKIKNATLAGTRPPKVNSPEAIARELENIQKILEDNKDKLFNKKKIVNKYKNAKALVEQITKEINTIERSCKLFAPFLKLQKEAYEKRKDQIDWMLKKNYQTLVEAHYNLTGDCFVDWDKERLYHWVCPDKAAEEKTKSFMKDPTLVGAAKYEAMYTYICGLSGGERSKGLVFLMMSMWKIIDSPFYVLDEFESMMDEQGRKYIHDKLVSYSNENPDVQLLILTPLEIQNIEEYPNADAIILKKKG